MPPTRCTVEATMAAARGRSAVLGDCDLNDAKVEHCCPPSLPSDAPCSVPDISLSLFRRATKLASTVSCGAISSCTHALPCASCSERTKYPLELAVRARCHWLRFLKILANNHHRHHQPPRPLLADALSLPQPQLCSLRCTGTENSLPASRAFRDSQHAG
jgi:hypothetical protein